MKKTVIILAVAIVIVAGVLVIFRFMTGEDDWICQNGEWVKHGNPSAAKPTKACGNANQNSTVVNQGAGEVKNKNDNKLSDTVLSRISEASKFGWLGAGEDGTDMDFIRQAGGGWMRPHPGPAVWDMVQTSKDAAFDFTNMDKTVKLTQQYGLNLLITLWPFAEWDQGNRPDAVNCAVSSADEFLPVNDEKGRPSYLPLHRCNPADWTAYESFVQAVVERYDADGTSDMAGLLYPIKYWEAMNEPDLTSVDNRLDFYKQGAKEYAELLQHTYQAVKKADATASVLIAGAAGGNSVFTDFYKEVFVAAPEAKNWFDIGNVHCISNDQTTPDFNVEDYKKALTDYLGIKPVWVTEAEQFSGGDFSLNADRTKLSVGNAIAAGAQKIFFTRYNFSDNRTDMGQKVEESQESIAQSINAYKTITGDN